MNEPRIMTRPPERMTVGEFSTSIRDGRCLTGDGVLYRYGKPEWIRRMIERVQRRVLVNLCEAKGWQGGGMVAAGNAAWTHAGMILDCDGTVEQTSPHCRTALWTDVLAPGDRIMVVRPVELALADAGDSRRMLRDACRVARRDAQLRVPYPHRELLTYWLWSWGIRRTLWGHSFLDIFSKKTGNVCSASVVQWWQAAGLLAGLTGCDARAEAWYPGRMGCDPALRTVAFIEIVDESEQPTQGD